MSRTRDSEELPIAREQFLEWRSPRLGDANPSVLTNPVWEWLIRTRMGAYQAATALNGPSALEAGPGWCFDRFGQTTTALADGREALIAGEHEDHYDPDFYIYNDVVVRGPDGAITIYGYPRGVSTDGFSYVHALAREHPTHRIAGLSGGPAEPEGNTGPSIDAR